MSSNSNQIIRARKEREDLERLLQEERAEAKRREARRHLAEWASSEEEEEVEPSTPLHPKC